MTSFKWLMSMDVCSSNSSFSCSGGDDKLSDPVKEKKILY
jgi:hypothetical protein